MVGGHPTTPSGGAADLLRRLSALLDEADLPLRRLDIDRVAELTARQQRLLERLDTALADGPPADLDPGLVSRVREQLLRNRVVTAHVLGVTGRLGERVGGAEPDGYGADGAARTADAVGRIVRTAV